jgi:hypothetical protein
MEFHLFVTRQWTKAAPGRRTPKVASIRANVIRGCLNAFEQLEVRKVGLPPLFVSLPQLMRLFYAPGKGAQLRSPIGVARQRAEASPPSLPQLFGNITLASFTLSALLVGVVII